MSEDAPLPGKIGAIVAGPPRSIFFESQEDQMLDTARRTVVATIAVALIAAAPAVVSQAHAQESQSFQGELVNVDIQARTIDVMTADGKGVQFQFTDETKVTGTQDSVAGLATAKNARVTVRFTQKGETRTATEIQVEPAK